MNQQQARDYLVNKPFAVETFPFGADVAVFKVKHKMFATLSRGKLGKGDGEDHDVFWMNLKCDPQEAVMLRDMFPSVIPGYHMSKVHWNTIKLDGTIPQGEIERMIDNSFDLVVANMVKKDQQAIKLHL
ncbi:MmcQ/YjbR family DNA-binding protein [Paraglaciecola arctica]|uniref:MmcQ/YjbR family DNA-binding protein n=1 Tax=Paraglaciecola arctica TaxID=1128911 RepID=UPI001C07D7AA|nr:MmcQ/YjbR family DNA-binding protein [Paraglaciecola arctica]MBU3003535.1 MmcQ/YjbR family DNA-binding protein [Paraglaciecola arctica]